MSMQVLMDNLSLLAEALSSFRSPRLRLHPRQTLAFMTPATELPYGGAAGGGKSHLPFREGKSNDRLANEPIWLSRDCIALERLSRHRAAKLGYRVRRS
jgi:hypothetical protein